MTLVGIELLGWGLLAVGVVLSVIGFPGPLVAMIGLLIWGYYGVPAEFHLYELIGMGLVFGLAEALEQLGGLIGLSLSNLHRSGWWGLWLGNFVGFVVGVVTLNPLMVPIGMVLGAVGGEYYEQRSLRDALGTAVRFLLGKAGGYLAKIGLVLLTLLYAVLTRLI